MEMVLEKQGLDMQSGMSDKLFVAVWMVTYNHEDYIEQAIESIVNQKANFLYKLFIGEDCSTDNTRQICIGLKEKYPDKIHLVLNERNVGASQNAQKIFNLCFNSGAKYVAMCEGDDYWTDPLKLQKQVDFLETNQEYVLTFHPVQILNTDGVLVEDFITKVPENYEYQETLASGNNYIHTPSVLFRNIITSFPPEFMLSPIGDYFLYMILTNHGKIKIMNDTMAVYRQGVGVWSDLQLPERLLNTMFCIKLISSHFKDNKRILQLLSKQHFDLLKKLTNIEEKRTEIIDSFVIDLHQVSTRLTFGSLAKTAVIKIRRKLNKK